MPSSYPFPSIAALALSLYASDKRVEKLPTVTEYAPTSRVEIVHCDRWNVSAGLVSTYLPHRYESIGGDL